MCGISGIITNSYDANGENFASANNVMAHRGPDDEGYAFSYDGISFEAAKGHDSIPAYNGLKHIEQVVSAKVIFGHRRLSIIDIGHAGHQPAMMDNVILSYNGEIYNYLELRDELLSAGYSFETNTDTEVFLVAYMHWGVDAFKKFNGMWAAAIYDCSNGEVVLTRDRFGIKPLYYKLENGCLYFASELKFFKRIGVQLRENKEAIYHYVRHSITDYDDSTFFDGIYSVNPGEYLIYNQRCLEAKSYWSEDDLFNASVDQKSLGQTFVDSVKLRLRSDVPVGALLSGGVDSSTIVATVSKINGLENFRTFSAVFDDVEISERKYVEATAASLKFDPNFVYPTAQDLVENIDRLIEVQEQPFRSLSVLSQFLIYKHVSKNSLIKVLLNGQGADEVFTGYSEHYVFDLISDVYCFRLQRAMRKLVRLKRSKDMSYLKLIIWISRVYLSSHYNNFYKSSLYKETFKSKKIFKKNKRLSYLKSKLLHGIQVTALKEYLRYEDRNSMFFGLESRLPFLDYRMVQYGFSLPDEALIENGWTKMPIRNLESSRLPKSVSWRTDKAGFPSPQSIWQRRELQQYFDEVFSEIEEKGLSELLDSKQLASQYKKYRDGINDDWAFIWRIYCLYKWKSYWLTESS